MHTFFARLKPILLPLSIWVISLVLVGTWSIRHLPFEPSFPYYHDLSLKYTRELATFAHFDGIHYLRLIHKGYDDTGSQAFFPVYPLLVSMLSALGIDPLYLSVGLNLLFLLITFYVLSLSLTKHHLARLALVLLSFPASFYLITVYTESFFLLLVVLFFHLLSKRLFLLSALVAGLASGTRLVGIFLSVALMIELFSYWRKPPASYKIPVLLGSILISLSGFLAYASYLGLKFDDPLMFFHVQTMFDNGRSGDSLILLPQVIYRYLKIFLTVEPQSILYLRALWEFLTFSLALWAVFYYRRRLPLSSLLFCLLAIILPTLSGTLSSFPRYLLVLSPLFVVVATNLKPKYLYLLSLLQYVILIIVTALFVQGIFIA